MNQNAESCHNACREGGSAYRRGDGIHTDPYAPSSLTSHWWRRGWMDAADEDEAADENDFNDDDDE